MEPNDLKSTPPDDEHLDRWLRTHAALPPLADGDFSRRVLAALPAPARPSRVSPRLIAILLGAAAGAAVAAFQIFTAASVGFSLPAIDPEAMEALTQLTDPKLHMALGVTVLTLAYVFWHDVRQRVGW